MVGLIGKPNSGKTTFFNAATLGNAHVASYPFTTINPNVGVAYVTKPCVCQELEVEDNPINSKCIDGVRHIPVKLIDIAGLIPGASKGLGLGNKFLDDTRRADALIHVIDASGSTDFEGRPVASGSHDPLRDVEFVEKEYDLWVLGLLRKDWGRLIRMPKVEEVWEGIVKRLSGLGITLKDVKYAIRACKLENVKPFQWREEDLSRFVSELRKANKPVLIAANKVDLPSAREYVKKLRKSGRPVIPVSAEAELLLRRAAMSGLIRYSPGDLDFKINDPSSLTSPQLKALNLVKERVLKTYGSTGVQQAINKIYFDILQGIVVYPVEDENRFTDKKGHVLPDAYIVKKGSTARDLAYMIHTDLGKGFLYAIDAKRGLRVGADYTLQDGDVIKIVSTEARG